MPVFITYDGFTTTQDEALEAAYRSGKLPANAAIVIGPEPVKNEEEWDRVVAEYLERQRQQAEKQQPNPKDLLQHDPAENKSAGQP